MAPPRRNEADSPKIDRHKLRTKLRRLGDEYVFYMLDDALDVLSDAQLAEFVGQYFKLEEIAPDDGSGTGKRSLAASRHAPPSDPASTTIPEPSTSRVEIVSPRRDDGLTHWTALPELSLEIRSNSAYNAAILRALREIDPSASPRQIAAGVRRVAETARAAIKKNTWGPWQ